MSYISPAAEGTDFYVPHFEISLHGKNLDPLVIHDVTEVSYRDSLTDVDGFELTLANYDSSSPTYASTATRTFKYSDQDIFDPGKELKLKLGYLGGEELETMIIGDITSLTPSFPASGFSTLKVSGLNVLHRLRTSQRSIAYTNCTDGQIADQIAHRLGVKIDRDRDEGETHEYIFQDHVYDIVFLLNRAHAIGYELSVDENDASGTTIHYQPSERMNDVAYRLSYGGSLISFAPNLSTARQVAKVTVNGWDAVRKQPIQEHTTLSEIGTPRGTPPVDAALQGREEVISDRPVATGREAKTLATETLKRISKDLITARGASIGLPKLRAGCAIYLDGLGERFSGRYFVTATTHTCGESGYTTQFECRREDA
jgi:phage protein D